MSKLRTLSWVFVVTLASCELIVDIDVPRDPDRLVVNGLQSTDLPLTIEVTSSKYILDNSIDWTANGYPPLMNAVVTFYGDDGSTLKAHVNDIGFFETDDQPQEGHTYRVVASLDGFDDVEAEMKMPYSVKIKDVVWDSSGVDPDPRFYTNLKLAVTFDDPANARNYYGVIVGVHSIRTRQYPDDPTPRTDSLHSKSIAVMTDPAITTEDERKVRFSDATFNGQTYTAQLEVQLHGATPDDLQHRIYRVDVLLVSISEEYFKYEESVALYNEVQDDPFSQPVQVYSNVKNGLGIFAGASHDMRSWDRSE